MLNQVEQADIIKSKNMITKGNVEYKFSLKEVYFITGIPATKIKEKVENSNKLFTKVTQDFLREHTSNLFNV